MCRILEALRQRGGVHMNLVCSFLWSVAADIAANQIWFLICKWLTDGRSNSVSTANTYRSRAATRGHFFQKINPRAATRESILVLNELGFVCIFIIAYLLSFVKRFAKNHFIKSAT